MEVAHHVLHHAIVIDDGLLQAKEFLDDHLMVHLQLIVRLCKRLYLLCLGNDLLVHKVDLLDGYLFVAKIRGLPGCWSFSSDVVKGIFAVGSELGMLELPGIGPVGRGSITGRIVVVLSHLVEIVLVQLAHEGGEVRVLKVFGKDRLGELFVLENDKSYRPHHPSERPKNRSGPRAFYRAVSGESGSNAWGIYLYSLRTKSLELLAEFGPSIMGNAPYSFSWIL